MIRLRDIKLGTIDAKNELLAGDPVETENFVASFVPPPTLDIDKFISRKKYYVTGLKGTGKTALLRYISLKMEGDDSVSNFILFKSDIDEKLKRDFARASRVTMADISGKEISDGDYEYIWRWFIYRCIADSIENKEAKPFERSAVLKEFLEISKVLSLKEDNETGFFRFLPNIIGGEVEVSHNPSLKFKFEYRNENEKTYVNFSSIVQKMDSIFKSLVPSKGRLNIFFDELEINYSTDGSYKRDSELIRDLIVTIEKINSWSLSKGYPVCLYAAIRSEVLNSFNAIGKEINKPMSDFGSTILWNRVGLDASQQPLLDIISQRINNALEYLGFPRMETEAIWRKYFPETIFNKSIQVYILHNSWYRPRDIIRLLLSVQEQFPDSYRFEISNLEAIRKSYSSLSWTEITEELSAKYHPREINGIKHILYGYKSRFNLAQLTTRCNDSLRNFDEVQYLLENKRTVEEIVKDLYRIGVIGNINVGNGSQRTKMRFSFRGDDEVLMNQDFYVHNALRTHLSIE